MTNKKNQVRWKFSLQSGTSAVAGIGAGLLIGIYFKPLARLLAPFGEIYLHLLRMCILPIVVTSIVVSLAKIVRTPEIRNRMGRFALYFFFGLLLPSCIGVVAGLIGAPGKALSDRAMSELGTMLMNSGTASNPGSEPGLLPFLLDLVPSNIFYSLSTGDIVSIVFFCILTGLALGLTPSKGTEDALSLMDVLTDTFMLIFDWTLSILPFGICCLFAGLVVDLDFQIFTVFIKYIIIFYITSVLLVLFYNLLLTRSVKRPFWSGLGALKEPLILAYTVDSSFVTLAPCLEVLHKRLKVDKRVAGMLLPFGFIANRHGKIFLFAFTSIFLSQVYGIHLGAAGLAVVILACSLVGMAAVGSGIILAASLSIVLQSVAVPDALAPIVLIAMAPVVDRMQSLLTVLSNCALTALVDGRIEPDTAGEAETVEGSSCNDR